jgi:hypothetical protein
LTRYHLLFVLDAKVRKIVVNSKKVVIKFGRMEGIV